MSLPAHDYCYEPFRPGARYFRLLEIYPDDNGDSQIICRLDNYKFDDHPSYTALSYEWGSKSSHEWIVLDCQTFPVTKNLAKALRTLRAKNCPLVWIDAVCTNQDSKQEKDAHIPMMAEIYHEAEFVWAWVGPEMAESDKVMEMLRAIDRSRREAGSPWMPSRSKVKDLGYPIQNFLDRSYWRRVWIIQELAAASTITILCGKTSASWVGLDLLIPRILECAKSLPADALLSSENLLDRLIYSAGYKNICRLIRFRKHRIDRRPVGLLENICQGATAEATEPLDRIFALRGLSHDGPQLLPNPTYKWSEKTMCMEMTTTFFRSKKSLDIMFLAGVRTMGRRELSLRTWCPNYLRLPLIPYITTLATYISGDVQRFRVGQVGSRWQATGDSMATRRGLEIDEQHFLATTGFKLSVIDSLGVSPDNPSQPPCSAQFQGKVEKNVAIGAINDAISLYTQDYSDLSSSYELLNYLFASDWDIFALGPGPTMSSRFKKVSKWRDVNNDFMVGGESLKDRGKVLPNKAWAALLVAQKFATVWSDHFQNNRAHIIPSRDVNVQSYKPQTYQSPNDQSPYFQFPDYIKNFAQSQDHQSRNYQPQNHQSKNNERGLFSLTPPRTNWSRVGCSSRRSTGAA